MKKKITYVAYNGMEFEDKKECEEYEQYAIDMAFQLTECYAFFDKEGICLPPAIFDCFEDFCEWLEDTYNDCEYISKIKDCPASAISWARNECGIYIPDGANGRYRFNFHVGAWLLESKMA